MEKVEYHGIAIGGKIYSLRTAKGLTQEQLASVLRISPAAVSKWERNLSVPGVEMLWALADFFDCSIDELVGRILVQVQRVGAYDEENFRLAMIGADLLKCSEISRAEGLLAMERTVPQLTGGSKFLAFAISYTLDLFLKQVEPDLSFRLLENYTATLPEAEQKEARMIVAVLKMIFAGNCAEIIQETIASHIGIDYRERMNSMSGNKKYTRQEVIHKYQNKGLYSANTNLLEEFANLNDFDLQVILKNTENNTLTVALVGASGNVVTRFLSNLSDRMLYFISEDMDCWQGTEEEILTAQRKLRETGSFCLNKAAE